MSQYEFDQLLQKYLAGQCDPAEEKLILDWYQDMVTQRPEPVNAREKAVIRQRIWQKLAANTTGINSTRQRIMPYGYAVAASIALLVGFGLWYYSAIPSTTRRLTGRPVAGAGLTNNSPKARPIRLEDGSLVTLKPGGTLSYPDHFGPHNRTVWLKGDAFFNVKKDPAKPFIVHTGNLVTEVLGTSFTIRASKGAKAIEVAVVTGRVSVYQAADGAHRRSREVILRPNERVTYTEQRPQLIPALVEHPVRVAPLTQPLSLVFDGLPLPEVVARLQQVYEIDIFLESDGLKTCVLNADLNDLPLHEQLDLLCRSVNAQYDIRGTSIFIRGDGCQ